MRGDMGLRFRVSGFGVTKNSGFRVEGPGVIRY